LIKILLRALEPSSGTIEFLGLDLLTKKAVMANLKRLAEQKKTTIVRTSHELDVIDTVHISF